MATVFSSSLYRFSSWALLGAFVAMLNACGGSQSSQSDLQEYRKRERIAKSPAKTDTVVKEDPPASGKMRPLAFPEVQSSTLKNGLAVHSVQWTKLPIVYATLVLRRGQASDPKALPGVVSVLAGMLKQGTRKHSSKALADAVEFYGASLSVSSDADSFYVRMRCLRDNFPQLLALMAEVVTQPTFPRREFKKLITRRLNRLRLRRNEPRYLAREALYRELYTLGGSDHPYARVDTDEKALKKMRTRDLQRWHRKQMLPNNAFLVVVGDMDARAVTTQSDLAFKRWKRGKVPAFSLPKIPPTLSERYITVVNRPGSVQSVIYIGNLALTRSSSDYVPLRVVNQVLGGSAASRLFMDLREKRSLTYGAYSAVVEREGTAPFVASAAVRTEVTAEAMQAFFEHLVRINTEAPPADELKNAQRYLNDHFPLSIDTPGKILSLIVEQQRYGLAADYWDHFRTQVAAVTPDAALKAASQYICKPADGCSVVIVGDASKIAQSLSAVAAVNIVDRDGALIRKIETKP